MRDFEADRKLCDAATKGEWKAKGNHCGYEVVSKNLSISGVDRETGRVQLLNQQDAEFIAAARDGWPDALDYIAELETACQKYSLAIRILDNKNAELLQKTQQVDELLQKAQRLELMLKLGAAEAAKCCCPYDSAGKDVVSEFCNGMCEVDGDKPARCWIEYWGKLANGGE